MCIVSKSISIIHIIKYRISIVSVLNLQYRPSLESEVRMASTKQLDNFDVTICLPFDIMHTVYEGVAVYHLNLLLHYLIDTRKWLSLTELNHTAVQGNTKSSTFGDLRIPVTFKVSTVAGYGKDETYNIKVKN